jgi:hypothetical protein
MPLTMRPTGLGHGVYKDAIDFAVFSGAWNVGRIYERRGFSDAVRFFWSLHAVVLTRPREIHTDGHEPTLEMANEEAMRVLACLQANRGAMLTQRNFAGERPTPSSRPAVRSTGLVRTRHHDARRAHAGGDLPHPGFLEGDCGRHNSQFRRLYFVLRNGRIMRNASE